MEPIRVREKTIIRLLLDNRKQFITSNELAEFCHVSVRTIKNDIKAINNVIKEHGAEIESELFTGYALKVSDNYLFNQFLKNHNVLVANSTITKPVYPYERINYIIKKLLAIDYYISIDNLMDELYVSRSTLTSDLKEVRSIFQEYNLRIETKPNYGIILDGDEINKRLCISEYYFHNDVGTGFLASDNAMFVSSSNKIELAAVSEILSRIISENSINMTDASFQDMVIHVIIAIRRYKFYNYVKMESGRGEQIKAYHEYAAGVELKNALERWQNIILPDTEALYFAMHFHAKHINDSNELNQEEKLTVNRVLDRFCAFLKDKYNFEYKYNATFEQFFRLHIPLMIQRIKSGIIIRNKDALSIFMNYPLAAHVAYDLCVMIEEEYQIKINSNEFAYLVLYCNLLLTQREKERANILLVCSSGRLASVTIVNEIENTLSGYIRNIDICDYSKVETACLEDYNLVLFTMDIPDIRTTVPLVKLDESRPYGETVKNAVDLYCLYDIRIEDFIKDRFFLNRMSGTDRYDVLKTISRLFSNSEEVYETLLEEQMIIAETEKNMVFLNSRLTVDEDFIFIGVLKKPIIWRKQWVQMIIWVNVRDNDIKRLQSCYYYLGKILNTENIIQRISAMKNSDELIRLLR